MAIRLSASRSDISSLPVRERGLKYGGGTGQLERCRSLPVRERGLKYHGECHMIGEHTSLPVRERGLKFLSLAAAASPGWSLPVRERGLKFVSYFVVVFYYLVAPRAGAWIEIVGGWGLAPRSASRSPCGSVD